MENYGIPRICYKTSEEISEDIPEDLPEYPKKFSKVLRINGDPRRSSEILGYPRVSFWGELQDVWAVLDVGGYVLAILQAWACWGAAKQRLHHQVEGS